MNTEECIWSTVKECEEYLEMMPTEAHEWMFVCQVLARKLLMERDNSQFYKRMYDGLAKSKY